MLFRSAEVFHALKKVLKDRAQKDGKQTVMQNALDRIEKYQTELATLEAEIALTQGEKISG